MKLHKALLSLIVLYSTSTLALSPPPDLYCCEMYLKEKKMTPLCEKKTPEPEKCEQRIKDWQQALENWTKMNKPMQDQSKSPKN